MYSNWRRNFIIFLWNFDSFEQGIWHTSTSTRIQQNNKSKFTAFLCQIHYIFFSLNYHLSATITRILFSEHTVNPLEIGRNIIETHKYNKTIMLQQQMEWTSIRLAIRIITFPSIKIIGVFCAEFHGNLCRKNKSQPNIFFFASSSAIWMLSLWLSFVFRDKFSSIPSTWWYTLASMTYYNSAKLLALTFSSKSSEKEKKELIQFIIFFRCFLWAFHFCCSSLSPSLSRSLCVLFSFAEHNDCNQLREFCVILCVNFICCCCCCFFCLPLFHFINHIRTKFLFLYHHSPLFAKCVAPLFHSNHGTFCTLHIINLCLVLVENRWFCFMYLFDVCACYYFLN